MIGPKHIGFVVALVVVGGLFGMIARDSATESRSCSTVMGSEVCTWVTMDRGAAVELGATIPLALIETVPLDAPMVWPPEELAIVPLSPEARAALGVDHMAIHWEPHGHPPAAFLTQHFDFHFYTIPADRVRSIDCSDVSKPGRLPSGYTLPDIDIPGMGVLVGLCVPNMGMHAMIETEVTGTELFDASMVLGYYGGQPLFFEPMVSRERLLSRTDFSLSVPRVDGLAADVRYPRQFRAEYDRATDAYRLVFTEFGVS